MSRADALVLIMAAGLVAFSYASFWAPSAPGSELRIVQGDSELMRLSLASDQMLEVAGPAGITQVEIRDGAARCASSPGPRGICEGAGWLREAGDVAVSLPNRLIIEVLGQAERFDSLNY